MNRDAMTVDRIQWEKCIPALRLLHAVRLACTAQVLVPALLVTILSLECSFLASSNELQPSEHRFGAVAWPSPDGTNSMVPGNLLIRTAGSVISWPVSAAIADSAELTALFSGRPVEQWIRLAVNLLLIGFGGTTICHAAARSFCRQSQEGVVRSARAATSSARSILVSTALGIGLIAVTRLILILFVQFTRLTGLGEVLHSQMLFIACCFGLLCCLTFVVIACAWGVSLAAIGTDRCDGSDAISRGINYVLSHRLRTALYLGCILLILWTVGELVGFLGSGAAGLVYVSLQPSGDLDALRNQLAQTVAVIVDAFRFGMLFCGLTLAYLLLREHEDGIRITELDGGRELRGDP